MRAATTEALFLDADREKREREKEFPAWAIAKKRAVEDALAEQRRREKGGENFPDGIVLVAERQAARPPPGEDAPASPNTVEVTRTSSEGAAPARVSKATVPLPTGGTRGALVHLPSGLGRAGLGQKLPAQHRDRSPATEAGHQRRGARPLHPHACDPPSPVRTASFGTAARTGRQPGEDLAEQAGARGVSRGPRANGSARGRHHRVRRAQRVSHAARLRVRLRRRTRQGSVHCLETVQPVHPLLLEGFKSSGRVQDAGDRRRVARLAAPPLLPVRHAQRARTAISGRALEECRALQCRRRYRME